MGGIKKGPRHHRTWSPERLLAEVISAASYMPTCAYKRDGGRARLVQCEWHEMPQADETDGEHGLCALSALAYVYGATSLDNDGAETFNNVIRFLDKRGITEGQVHSFTKGFDGFVALPYYVDERDDRFILAGFAARAELLNQDAVFKRQWGPEKDG